MQIRTYFIVFLKQKLRSALSRVIFPGEIRDGLAVVCENGVISDILPARQLGENVETVDAGGLYLAPGFVDIHVFENDIICRCGKKGCLETEVSGMALRRKLTERIRHGESSILSDRVLQSDIPLSPEEITDAVHREDALCIDAIDEIGTLLGVQVASMINIFNPDAVVIGGELAMTGDYLLQPLKTSVNKHVLNRVREDTVIRTSQLGEDAGVIGGCLMARSLDFGLL